MIFVCLLNVKILIEKLLRSCPEIGDIYLLVRPKKKLNPNERIENMFNLKR